MFLRKLPLVPQLRSLYIPYFADHVHGNNLDSQELALQVLDIVSLRPELELCYLGIQTKCFEILEYAGNEKFSNTFPDVAAGGPSSPMTSSMSTESDEPDSDDNVPHNNHHHHHYHHHHPHHHNHHNNTTNPHTSTTVANDDASDPSFSASEDDDDEEEENEAEDSESEDSNRPKKGKHFKLREILFYDDKVSIFKARHGRI